MSTAKATWTRRSPEADSLHGNRYDKVPPYHYRPGNTQGFTPKTVNRGELEHVQEPFQGLPPPVPEWGYRKEGMLKKPNGVGDVGKTHKWCLRKCLRCKPYLGAQGCVYGNVHLKGWRVRGLGLY